MRAVRKLIIRDQISGIVAQIKKPKTEAPEKEVPELVADLMRWWEEDRKTRRDWSMVK